jgi:hypothetical protein
MGERAAYRVSSKGKSLFMLRKQWYEGSSYEELEALVEKVASQLMSGRFSLGNKILIGDGSVALRDDLQIGRLSMAMLTALSDPPFNEVVEADDIHCDINDHGIYEIELVEWNKWCLNNYPVEYQNKTDVLGEKKHLATITFIEGTPFPDGMNIEFHVPDNWEYPED